MQSQESKYFDTDEEEGVTTDILLAMKSRYERPWLFKSTIT